MRWKLDARCCDDRGTRIFPHTFSPFPLTLLFGMAFKTASCVMSAAGVAWAEGLRTATGVEEMAAVAVATEEDLEKEVLVRGPEECRSAGDATLDENSNSTGTVPEVHAMSRVARYTIPGGWGVKIFRSPLG